MLNQCAAPLLCLREISRKELAEPCDSNHGTQASPSVRIDCPSRGSKRALGHSFVRRGAHRSSPASDMTSPARALPRVGERFSLVSSAYLRAGACTRLPASPGTISRWTRSLLQPWVHQSESKTRSMGPVLQRICSNGEGRPNFARYHPSYQVFPVARTCADGTSR